MWNIFNAISKNNKEMIKINMMVDFLFQESVGPGHFLQIRPM